jgi:hypothetical protein
MVRVCRVGHREVETVGERGRKEDIEIPKEGLVCG